MVEEQQLQRRPGEKVECTHEGLPKAVTFNNRKVHLQAEKQNERRRGKQSMFPQNLQDASHFSRGSSQTFKVGDGQI